MSDRKVNLNYINRDFLSVKNDLKSFIKLNYADQYNDFAESSVGMMLLELNAYVGDMLSYHIDQKFNELFFDTAKNRDSILRLAKNLGYKPGGKRPSVTMLDISINVPTLGDGYDPDFMITLEDGFRARSTSGKKYEVTESIDFSKQVNGGGVNNRTITPVYNNNNEIIKYKVVKRMSAMAGESKIATLEITNDVVMPYMKWYVNEGDFDITEIRNMVSKDNRFSPIEEVNWTDGGENVVWDEVSSLPQERVFVDSSISDSSEGYWKYTENRYIVDYDKNGDCFLTFGAGYNGTDNYDEYIANGLSGLNMSTILNNDSLGRIPAVGSYMHCRYRTGGGQDTNAGQGTITKVDSFVVSDVPGSVSPDILQTVIGSIAVTNPIPAVGGRGFLTDDEIRHYAPKHFSSQDRCVTTDDYISRVSLMPINYGTVFRSYATSESGGGTKLFILSLDENGNLKNSGNGQLKKNLASYLNNYKMLGDFVVIEDGTIINISVLFSIQVVSNINKKTSIANCIRVLKEYFSINRWQMNDTIYISQVTELLRKQPGVINVVDVKFYNMVDNGYSNDVLSNEMTNSSLMKKLATGSGAIEIVPVANKITAPKSGMFEIKHPNIDIKGSAL